MRNYWTGVATFTLGALLMLIANGVASPIFWAPLLIAAPVFVYGYVTLKKAGR